MALLGLDVGTTGCKAIIYNHQGKKLGSCYQEYQSIAENGRFEIDPNTVWESVCKVLTGAVSQSGETVNAVGISSFGESAVPIDINGTILANAILYTDPRGEEECKLLENFTSITKVSAHPMYTISKILWQKKNQPELFSKVYKYLLFEDFIIYKLTGNYRISYSEATRTGCFDVTNKSFSQAVLSATGLSADLFSTPVPSGTICGKAKNFPLLSSAVVTTGGQDQICSALGAGATQVGSAVCGIGTVECITPVFASPIENMETLNKGYCCVPYATGDTYVTYAYSYTGGAMLKWFRDKIADTNAVSVYQTFDEKVKNSSTDLLLLPHFAGAATPYMDINATGAILGLTLSSTREDIYRAILEGCCFEMLLNIE
ncbi:MAG: FGGY-family carbohydrate kinase, partial [Oscillospiraceae bacterium]